MALAEAPARRRGQIAANVSVDRWDEAQMELTALRSEARADALHMADPARRLRESAMRDGRFSDFHDASALVARVERMARRGV